MTCRNHPIFKKSQCILLIWTFRLWFYRNRDFPTEFLVCKNWHSKYGVWSWPPRNAPNCSEFRSGLFRTSDLQWQICNSIFSTIVILENGSRTPELPLVFFGTMPKKKGDTAERRAMTHFPGIMEREERIPTLTDTRISLQHWQRKSRYPLRAHVFSCFMILISGPPQYFE